MAKTEASPLDVANKRIKELELHVAQANERANASANGARTWERQYQEVYKLLEVHETYSKIIRQLVRF